MSIFWFGLGQYAAWHVRIAGYIELLDELGDDVRIGIVVSASHDEVVTPHHAPATDKKHIDPRLIATLFTSDDIHILLPDTHDLLVFVNDLHRIQTVSQGGSTLKLEVFRRFTHRILQFNHDLVGIALQERNDLINDPVILRFVGIAGARRHTPLDVVFQAGTLLFTRDFHRARSVWKQLFEQVKSGSHRVSRRIRAEITSLVAF